MRPKTSYPRTPVTALAPIPKPTPQQAMPTTEMVVVNPQAPNPLAAMTSDKSPPTPVGKINPAHVELRRGAFEKDPDPRRVAHNLPLRDQTRNSNRRKIVNKKGRRCG